MTTDHDDWLEMGDCEPRQRYERDPEEVLRDREERLRTFWDEDTEYERLIKLL